MTIRHKIRNATDTLLAADGAVSSVVVDDDQGQYVAMNIGNGPALNVSYYFRFRRDSGEAWQSGPDPSYLPSVSTLQTPLLALLVNGRGDEHQIMFLFQSLGGRWYESVVSIRSKAIIDFGMRQLPQGFRPSLSYKPSFGD